VSSGKRRTRRPDVEFIWRVPANAAASRWRAGVKCAGGGKLTRVARRGAVVHSGVVTLSILRRRGAPAGTGLIARARSIRVASIAAEPLIRARATSGGWPDYGATLVAGSAWKVPGAEGRTCGGSVTWPCGVNVNSNNWSGWPYSPSGAYGQFGSYMWQCVELIERFLNLVGWYKGVLPAPDGTAASMYDAAPASVFVKHPNGSGYRPVPGDIVVYKGHQFGHIAIVESDDGNAVGVLEQNVLDENGRGTNQFVGNKLKAAWAGFSIIGFLHAKANTGAVTSGRGLLTIGVCGAMGEGAPPSPGGICTVRPDGSQLHQITTQPQDDEPAWSPDRKRVAFVRTDGRGSHLDIVNADGSGIQALTSGRADHAPAWSPKGDEIAFARSGRIAVVDVTTGDVTPLTTGPLDGDPSWSAGGSLIAFDRGAAPVQIDVMTSGGKNRRGLATGGQPAWAPTGTTLAYTRFTNFGSHIALIDGITGKAGRDLTTGPSDDSYTPAWSPDAKQIAFGRGVNMESPGVWVMDAGGTNQVRLTGGYHPDW
jgi:hypothetical protein